jgi:hypothetical protein
MWSTEEWKVRFLGQPDPSLSTLPSPAIVLNKPFGSLVMSDNFLGGADFETYFGIIWPKYLAANSSTNIDMRSFVSI